MGPGREKSPFGFNCHTGANGLSLAPAASSCPVREDGHLLLVRLVPSLLVATAAPALSDPKAHPALWVPTPQGPTHTFLLHPKPRDEALVPHPLSWGQREVWGHLGWTTEPAFYFQV